MALHFFIEEDAALTICNAMGQVIFAGKINKHQESKYLSLASLANGIYFFSLQTPSGRAESQKIILAR